MGTEAAGFALSEEPEGGLQVAELWGALEPGVFDALGRALERVQAPASGRLLVRLERVTACGLPARAGWMALQRRLGARGWRTAYLDPRPWGRGLALAVVHLAEDPHALACAQPARAREWLAGTGARLDGPLALLGVRP